MTITFNASFWVAYIGLGCALFLPVHWSAWVSVQRSDRDRSVWSQIGAGGPLHAIVRAILVVVLWPVAVWQEINHHWLGTHYWKMRKEAKSMKKAAISREYRASIAILLPTDDDRNLPEGSE